MKFHGLCPTSRSMYKPCNYNLHSGIITLPWADNTPFWISALIILLFILITLNKHLDDLINQHSFSDGRAISLQNNIFYSPPWCQIWLMSNFPFLNFTSIFPIPHFNHQNPHSVPPICTVPLVDSTPIPWAGNSPWWIAVAHALRWTTSTGDSFHGIEWTISLVMVQLILILSWWIYSILKISNP